MLRNLFPIKSYGTGKFVCIIGIITLLSGCLALPALVVPVIQGAISAGNASKAQAQKEANKKPELTQLQTRQLQTRTYDTEDTKKILQVSLAVLQDDGFSVHNANVDVGLLSASKSLHETNVDDTGTAFMKGFFGMGSGVLSQESSTVEANVTVTPYGEKTRIRLSARLASISVGADGGSNQYETITEPDFYQGFFAKLEKGLFIQQENL